MKIRRIIAASAAVLSLSVVAACGAADDASSSTSNTSSGTTWSSTSADAAPPGNGAAPSGQGGPGGAVDVSAVDTVDELNNLIQEAYGDGGLGLHRGHQPVESILNEVLKISHDELHVRMEEQGQNLAAVATDLGLDPETLIDAMVDSWSVAIDNTEAAGTITSEQADAYLEALKEAFTFRVTWNGTDATPTFDGVDV